MTGMAGDVVSQKHLEGRNVFFWSGAVAETLWKRKSLINCLKVTVVVPHRQCHTGIRKGKKNEIIGFFSRRKTYLYSLVCIKTVLIYRHIYNIFIQSVFSTNQNKTVPIIWAVVNMKTH